MEVIDLEEFHARLGAQGIPAGRHLAFKCVMCGTIQSMESFVCAGATREQAESHIGFSCIGRWTNAGPHRKNAKPGLGCDWSLGGSLTLHKLEVVDGDGKHHPRFELASPDEAKALMESNSQKAAQPVQSP